MTTLLSLQFIAYNSVPSPLLKFYISFKTADFISDDEAAFAVLEHAEGCQIHTIPVYETDNTLSCIIPHESQETFQTCINKDPRFSVLNIDEVEDINWLSNCKELWSELVIGRLCVTPVISSENVPKPSENQIVIEPGTGFGTGHHPCTHMLLEYITEEEPLFKKALKLLDFGTGSGILALAINKLYDIPVLAIEHDELALINARHNLALNGCDETHIQFVHDDKLPPSTHFDVIIANIYTDLLIDLKDAFQNALSQNGTLLISGILNEQIEHIYEHYTDMKITSQKQLSDENNNTWHALLLTK